MRKMALLPLRIAADIWRNRFLIGHFIKLNDKILFTKH
jgi:hypothetical protein